jgi:ankyrin repeat protein
MQSIFDAIAAKDADELARLVEKQPDLAAACNPQGVSALLFARYHGNARAEAVLRARLPRLTVHEAAAVGALDTIRSASPAELEQTSPDGFTPLHLAAFFGHVAAAALLVERGANVNAESANAARLSPLNSAAACRDRAAATAIGKLLLERGADPAHAQSGGHTPLDAALHHGYDELAEALRAATAP